MSKQAEVSKKRRLVCYDADIFDLLSESNSDVVAEDAAKVFEWFFMFCFGKKTLSRENGFVTGGRRWAKFDYAQLLKGVNRMGTRVRNKRALEKAVKALEDANLLIAILSKDFPGDGKSNGKYYAMRFDEMPQPVRQGYKDEANFRKHRVQYGLDQWDMAWDEGEINTLTPNPSPTEKRGRRGIRDESDETTPSVASATPPPNTGEGEEDSTRAGEPSAPTPTVEIGEGEIAGKTPSPDRLGGEDSPPLTGWGVDEAETAVDGAEVCERKRLNGVGVRVLPPRLTGWGPSPDRWGLYIRNLDKESFDKEKDNSVSNETVGDAHLEAEILDEDDFQIGEPESVFAAIGRVVYRKLNITQTRRDAIKKAIGFIRNQKYGGKYIVLDKEMIEDYAIWRVLFDIRGAFPPSINKFEEELPQVFMQWYDSKTYRSPLVNFKQRYPDWRQRLFVGDYGALRQEVQDDMQKLKQANSKPRSNGALKRRPIKPARYDPELEAHIAEHGEGAPLSDAELDARGIF